jgi:3-mercaptopyruvate sulfurtransferase SseA
MMIPGGMFAGRLWWLLRWLGHDRVAVLDGGIDHWIGEGRAVSTAVPRSAPAVLKVDLRDSVVEQRRRARWSCRPSASGCHRRPQS